MAELTCPTAAAAAYISVVPSVANAVCVAGALACGALGIGVRGLRRRYLSHEMFLPGGGPHDDGKQHLHGRQRARTSDRLCCTHHSAPSATMVADATLLSTPICAALLLLMPMARLFTGCGPVRRPERTGPAGKLARLNSRCVCGCAHCCCPSEALANIIFAVPGSWVHEPSWL